MTYDRSNDGPVFTTTTLCTSLPFGLYFTVCRGMETQWFTTQETFILEIESRNENNKINMFSKSLEIENEIFFSKNEHRKTLLSPLNLEAK